MELFLLNHNYRYAVEQMLLTMFPKERPVYPGAPSGAPAAELALKRGGRFATARCRLSLEGGTYRGEARVSLRSFTDPLVEERLLQRAVKLAFYRAALRSGALRPVWGALTGIRPASLVRRLLDEGLSERAAMSRFIRDYDVSPERAAMCLQTALESRRARQSLERRDVCLYIGIPYCPTRCAYCSFVSADVSRSMESIPSFLTALGREMEAAAAAVRACNLRVVSVYMGGGTPTTLSEEQLEGLCTQLGNLFDLRSLREYCVEAGRPDTITAGKMAVLRRHGVTRVSVNPQSMSDRVLEAIGRRHSAARVAEALEIVRGAGDFDVNMDLIAGLPADDPANFEESLLSVLRFKPENITVHTLALKKGSRLLLEGTALPSAEEVGQMLDAARKHLKAAGFMPYYLYRQKFMSGGFENVGWTRPAHASLYNLCMMEELCSILAMGCGASTKLVTGTGRLERLFNPKYPREYIAGLDRVIGDKTKIAAFYDAMP
jgi:oxygen-independent coproporphyrinogen-3 oxidase